MNRRISQLECHLLDTNHKRFKLSIPSTPRFHSHCDCSLLCKPASAKDVLLFFAANYAAHAGTVISRPGQSTLTTLVTPGTGVFTGILALTSLAWFAPTELTKAASAGALCIVVKTDNTYHSVDTD